MIRTCGNAVTALNAFVVINPRKHFAAIFGRHYKLCAFAINILAELSKTVFREHVGCSLYTLSGKPHASSDQRYNHGALPYSSGDLPPGA